MRAQFNQTGGSNYHLILHPNVLPAVTINVPYGQGELAYFFGGSGVIFAIIDSGWWSAQMANLQTTSDPTHLAIFLTDSVMLGSFKKTWSCCTIGFHFTRT